MSEAGLLSAIEGPARRAGLRLEPAWSTCWSARSRVSRQRLPCSHALRETWERREGPTLTVGGYRATGGIRQAVARSAESVYDAMDATQQSRLRTLLLRLVMPTEDGDAVRARVPRAKVAVDAAHERVVERLVEARLVSIDGDSVQIAHEALVRVAATARLARRRRRRPTAVPTPGGRRRRLGVHGAARQRSSTGATGSAAPWTGVTGPARA
jgi:hypothetical protein